MNSIPTYEEIEQLTYKESKAALKSLTMTYSLDTEISKLTKEEWARCDDIANALLWLEDRINRFDDPRINSMNPAAQVIVTKKPEEKKPNQAGKFCNINGTIYESVREASRKSGIKESTLRSWIKRKPDLYFYVDMLPEVTDDNTSTTN
jgi:hypothetical protein